MKKIKSKLLIIAVCAMSLTACDSAQQEVQEKQQTEISVENKETETAQEDVVPAISIESDTKSWYTEDDSKEYFKASYPIVTVSNGFEELQNVFSSIWNGIDETKYSETLEIAKEDYSLYENKEYFSSYYSEQEVSIVRCDSSIVSFEVNSRDYTGGAHGYYSYYGVTFDVKAAKELELWDVLTDADGFREKAIEDVKNYLETEVGEELFEDYAEYVASSFGEEGNLSWYLDEAGINIIYNPYEVSTYARGVIKVVLPYEEYGMYMKTEYQVSTN